MLVLAIYGSPRKRGNTDLMMDAFLEGAASGGAQIERIYVRDLQISGCLGCGHCDKTGTCVQKDSMETVYPLLDRADRIVAATPIYFYGVTGQLKLLIDRSQAMYMRKEIEAREGRRPPATGKTSGKTKEGFLLCAGATRGKRLFECAVLTVKYFFEALGADYAGDICFRELEEKGAVLDHPDALDQCRAAGKEFVSAG
jgi:multimeric flavodoxin WrbA